MTAIARSTSSFTVIPLTPTIGAEIGGIDLRQPLNSAAINEGRTMLAKHKVIFFRDQDITREQHLAFAKCFGELETFRGNPMCVPGYDEVLHIYDSETSTEKDTNQWHSDFAGIELPTFSVVLRAVNVPEIGGDTLFADMGAAYQGLPETIKQRIEGLVALNDERLFATKGYDAKTRNEIADNQYPPHEHPVVRVIPETGEKILYVNEAQTVYIKGLDLEEGKELLSTLVRQACKPEYQVRFRWKNNSIAFWDNRSTQHYARGDYWGHVRSLERISLVGHKP